MLNFEHISINPKKQTQGWKLLEEMCRKENGTTSKTTNIKVVCISDTHCVHREISLPGGDILIHAGDCTRGGTFEQLRDFLDWFSTQPFSHRIWIAGNHDITLDQKFYAENWSRFHRKYAKQDLDQIQSLIRSYDNITYLEDTMLEVEGLKIYGSPWQPTFFNWAFNVERGCAIDAIWSSIPSGVDIVMTHGPPLGYGDLCNSGIRAGCANLLHHIMYRIQPRVHIFGHIHEDVGIWNNGTTNFVNAASCSLQYQIAHSPQSFWL